MNNLPLPQQERVVLIVEDDPYVADLLSLFLQTECGCQVLKAPDASSAFEAVNKVNLDLIILDVILPDMNGFELYDQLQAGQDTQLIPVLFITAANSVQDFKHRNITDYLDKPFDLDDVANRVQVLLNRPG